MNFMGIKVSTTTLILLGAVAGYLFVPQVKKTVNKLIGM